MALALKCEAFIYSKLQPLLAALDQPVPLFAGFQSPSQATPYVSYSRAKTNPEDRPLDPKGSFAEEAMILIDVVTTQFQGSLDVICAAILTLDGASDANNVQGCFLSDFRWLGQQLTIPGGGTKWVLHAQMYFYVWSKPGAVAPEPPAESAQPPAIGSIAPLSGKGGTGQQVTISGSGFANVQSVTFGGVTASLTNGLLAWQKPFTVVSEQTITAVIPAGTKGAVEVVVKTPAGQASIEFTYTS